MKVGAALSVLVLTLALLGFAWATCAIEAGVVVCLVSIDRTASPLVDRWGRGAVGEELVGCRGEADRADHRAKLRAAPLLVFSNAYVSPAVTRRDGVVILPARILAGHLQRRGGTIPPERVNDVYRRLAAALPG